MKDLSSAQYANFGRAVLDILNDSPEWDSDTLQTIGDLAFFQYGITFDDTEQED